MKISGAKIHYKQLNEKIHDAIRKGVKNILLSNINGQRYIASGLKSSVKIKINGVAGDDLGAFMNGPQIFVNGNAQDAVGNTMAGGEIIINGHAGDAIGYSMRGGKIFIKDYVGYRVGIHMKQYKDTIPTIVIGGCAKDFLGEYMAGGIIILFGLGYKKAAGKLTGTGMHGGVIYIPSEKMPERLSKTLTLMDCAESDFKIINHNIEKFIRYFKPEKSKIDEIKKLKFKKIIPATHRPYGSLYAY